MLLVLLIPEDDQDVTEAQDYLTSFFFFKIAVLMEIITLYATKLQVTSTED